jgi:hypothetical protein
MTAALAVSLLNVVLPALLLWWTICRARFMDRRTRHADRISIVALGGGALAFALDAMLPLLQLLGVRIPVEAMLQWAPWETWKEALLLSGVFGWCVMPTIRQWLDARRACE